jgi:hypothetical protein
MTAKRPIGIGFTHIPPDADQWRIIDAVVDALIPLGDTPESIAAARRIKEQVCSCFSGFQDVASGRVAIQRLIAETCHQRGEAEQVFESLLSEKRLSMVIRTTVRMAHAMRDWRDSQQKSVLFMWPAAEFYFAEGNDEQWDWKQVWRRNGGKFFRGPDENPGERMIALKDDPIWVRINAFRFPFSPFDFESGMDTRDIDADEAEAIGLAPSIVGLPPSEKSIRNYLEALKIEEVVRARYGKFLAGELPA